MTNLPHTSRHQRSGVSFELLYSVGDDLRGGPGARGGEIGEREKFWSHRKCVGLGSRTGEEDEGEFLRGGPPRPSAGTVETTTEKGRSMTFPVLGRTAFPPRPIQKLPRTQGSPRGDEESCGRDLIDRGTTVGRPWDRTPFRAI